MAHLAQAHFTTENGAQEIFAQSGMLCGTMVMTLAGEVPVESIAPGDRIITRRGMRKVTSVVMTEVEQARVVRIAPNSLGVERPKAEIVVSPEQQLFLRDWRAKAMYNVDEALVSAARLCDGEYMRQEVMAEAYFFSLHFEMPEVIYADGLELACAPMTVDA
jgi:hypothetical protein